MLEEIIEFIGFVIGYLILVVVLFIFILGLAKLGMWIWSI
jgi:hypothetical protein